LKYLVYKIWPQRQRDDGTPERSRPRKMANYGWISKNFFLLD
jgi:hypothetical protein